MLDLKKQIRPVIPSIIETAQVSVEEKFQNDVLRPIIKLQNDLILCCFENHIARSKIDFSTYNDLQKTDFIQQSFTRDIKLKGDFRSLIIGLFTLEEYKEYHSLGAQMNKRINSIIQKRITDFFVKEV